MKNSKFKLIRNIKLISIYIFDSESSIKTINKIYSAAADFGIKTELIKITAISFSIAAADSEETDNFIESLNGFSEIRIRENLSLIHIDNSTFSSELLSDIFSALNEEELRMIHYRSDSKRVTIISDNDKLDKIYRKISSLQGS